MSAGLPTRVIRSLLPCMHGQPAVIDACVAGLLAHQHSNLEREIARLERARTVLAGFIA